MAKIPNVPCLYRHKINGTYYGIKKINGKEKDHSLDTTDRKEAERNLKDWINALDKVDAEAQRTTLDQLLQKFQKTRQGMSKSTRDTESGMIKKLKSSWKPGLDMRVSDIKPSMLDEWLGQHEHELKNSSYNRYTLFLKQLFEVAVGDKMIAESPVARLKRGWKRPQKPLRHVPTQEQFEIIIKSIRSQEQNVEADESADFVEFMGLAGLGQAEASSLTLGDIDWGKERIRVRRRKTGELFYVPIYPHLKAPLEELVKKFPVSAPKDQKLFKIKDARKALTNACARLQFPHFSQRNIRQVLIRRLWQSGLDHKLIAKWQGHQDGGKLILDTYTEVFGANDESYEKAQLAKIS
ncbi:MAG: tyrosine-type recombinase/integrase [Verrucomicrobia bacterium]|nr:tyrosine-type recombinase/integrase [Verrucomicrobiota bacterium]